MAKYRKKPVVVEAMQFRGTDTWHDLDYAEIFDAWLTANQGDRPCRYVGGNIVITTLEGDMTALPGDFIICGIQGELYPCKLGIFVQTYEAVE